MLQNTNEDREIVIKDYVTRYDSARSKVSWKRRFFEVATGKWVDVAAYELKAAEIEESIRLEELEEARKIMRQVARSEEERDLNECSIEND